MEILLLRHGRTLGNRQRRYIGSTDEPLEEACHTPEGIAELRHLAGLPFPAERLYTSPLRRTIETAALLFPELSPHILPDLRECDFGAFEGKCYEELREDPRYQVWLASCGALPFPEGEDHRDFVLRCGGAFQRAVAQCLADGVKSVAFVIHGGTIMSILSLFSPSGEEFYHWQLPNGGGYRLTLTPDDWKGGEGLLTAVSQSERGVGQ